MTKNKLLIAVLLIALAVAGLFFATCEMPMGLGDPIDFEPPILTVDYVPMPYYVNKGATITGTVSDNIAVSEIVLRNAIPKTDEITKVATNEIIARAVLSNARSITEGRYSKMVYDWVITLDFDESRNGEKLSLEIVAFDRMGNSGEDSFYPVTVIIDVRPPIIDDMWIERTNVRRAEFENISLLKELEITDKDGHKSANVNRYQNGMFTIQGKASEKETRIEIIALNIYDTDPERRIIKDGIEEPLLSLTRIQGSSAFSPRWLVNEETLLDAGNLLWPGYKNNYYNGERYYYYVTVEAEDRSRNPNEPFFTEEGHGHFVMWEKGDVPKGELDPLIGTVVTKGGTLPVEFFDDDQLLWAYTGLFTKEQWDGESDIAPGGVKITGTTDADKLNFLHDRLRNGDPVYNWKFDRYNTNNTVRVSEPVKEIIDGKKLDERLLYIQTGNNDQDYGTFVLFSITADVKLDPHPKNYSGSLSTFKTRESLRSWVVDVIDENAPVIVLDVESGCPEENTFPSLTNGERFTIKGYTLRESGRISEPANNGVIKFRMAWIPSRMPGGSDSHIQAVQNALSDPHYPANFPAALNGVQHWEFNFSNYPSIPINYYNSDYEVIPKDSGNAFRKQPFQREFSILGNNVTNLNNPTAGGTGWKDFHSIDGEGNYTLENDTKLFILYAEDNMGHQVFRQMRLLGNNTPPDLAVYDITGRVLNNDMPSGIPDVRNFMSNDEVQEAYYTALNTYNKTSDIYTLFKTISVSLGDGYRTTPFQAYPRETILKYWIAAERTGDIAVQSITMKDITYEGHDRILGYFPMHPTDRTMLFAESYPDETQKVFLFEATDTLGNTARIQRTIAITNTAMLESITTTTQSGTYGIGEVITLQANFTGQIAVNTSSGKPLLNVRFPIYSTNSAYNGQYHVEQIEAEPATGSAMSLQFKFSVPNPLTFSCINDESNPCPNRGHGGVQIIALGKLETMYDHADCIGTGQAATDAAANEINRPIKTNGAVITDALRQGQSAFVPGYTIGTSTMHTWTNSVGSLQNPTGQTDHEKNIRLDAVRPVISSVSVSGKSAVTGQEYYFKTGETLTITLTSSGKSIKASSVVPRLQYYIQETPNSTPQGQLRGPYHATSTPLSTFLYTRPSGSNALVFSLPITDTQYDGEIVQISLVTTAGHGAIEDDVGNTVQAVNVSNLLPSGTRLYVKKAIPAAPGATLGTPSVALQNAGPNFNYTPQLTIPTSTATLASWEDRIEYSLNGGLSWTAYSAAVTIPNGSHSVRARYVDRAGNNGTERTRDIVVNANFPRLQGITAVQGNGTYRIGQRLDFEMSFADTVSYTNAANVTITLRDTSATGADNTIELRATGGSGTSTITFAWTGATGVNPFINKDMLNGLRITAINMNGLTDSFGTAGPVSANITCTTADQVGMPAQGSNTAYNVPYTLSNVRVSTIVPSVQSETPVNAAGKSGNITTSVSSNNRTITLTFNKPVQKGNGTITLRPHGTYAIPAVMEHNGYYVGIDANGQIINDAQGFEIRHTSGGTGRTYVSGFADIFNNVGATEKNNLIGSTNLSEPAVSLQTALPVGPYQRMTHGLTRGMGYTGNYGNTAALDTNTGATITRPGTNAPGPRDEGGATGSNFMIPDLETKWVLHYGYPDLFATTTPSGRTVSVANIRAAFTNAKWRWQEFAVTASNVQISGNTVTITLPEPVLPGLRWTLYYPAGTFSDVAGNPAGAIGYDEYWFWSAGAQRPVIRVDRKSYDARAGANLSGPRQNSTYAATGFNGAITTFNTINYVITTETPSSRIYYGTSVGTQANLSGVTGAWGGIANSESFTGNAITAGNNINWGGPLATVTTTARAATTNEYTSTGHNLGATGRIFQVRVGTNDRWLRVTGANTFRLYATQAAANTATAANGINDGDTVTIDSVQTTGRWIRPNLIYRHNYNNVYNLMLHFTDLQQTVGGLADTANALTGRFYGFRSFNKDATYTELFAIARSTEGGTSQNHSANFTYTDFEASKNYVVAETRVNHNNAGFGSQTGANISPRGYEGVFRTVVMLNMSTVTVANNDTPIILFGTNRINGIPTVPAFPLKDGVDQIDARFGKFYFRDESSAAGNGDCNRYYWVSTEIVSSWFIQNYGRGTGGSYTRKGDNNDWITAGYGDLVNTMDIQAW